MIHRLPLRLAVPLLLAGALLAARPALAEDAPAPRNPHAERIEGTFETGLSVTAACLECHEDAARDLMRTPHWKWQGPPRTLGSYDAKSTLEIGKRTLINNFCISIEGGAEHGNRTKCSKCHAGYGFTDASFDFSDPTRVDCLVCHAQAGGYHKSAGGEPDPKLIANGRLDLLAAARSVGRPTRKNCLSCHAYGGNGDCVKHGDMSEALEDPADDLDVHMGRSNMQCQVCHKSERHRIAGLSMFTATHDGRVACTDCHGTLAHDGLPQKATIARHLATVACETCHIPAFGRDRASLVRWDWSTAGRDDEPGEMHEREDYAKIAGSFTWAKDSSPVYAWFNGRTDRYLKGQKIEGNGPVALNRPRGDIHDPAARIFPFKLHTGKQPMDSNHRYLLTPHTYKGYWEHFDWQKALKDGSAGSGLPYSGAFEFVETVAWNGLHHMVPPKGQALRCSDCHKKGGGRIDWKALGYPGDPMTFGGRKLPAAPAK